MSSLFALLLFAALVTAAALAFVADGQRTRLRWVLRGELLLVWLTFAFSLLQIGQRTALTVVTRGAARQPQLVDGAVGQVGTLLVSLGGPLLLVTALCLWALLASREKGAAPVEKKRKRLAAKLSIVQVPGRDLDDVKQLFEEYARALDFELGLPLEGFQEEIRTLPGSYSAPRGRLLLARINGQPAGCVALLGGDGFAEMKRLFVRPDFRHAGLGRTLAEAALSAASELGHPRTRLDTLPAMREAIGLYRSLGFTERTPDSSAPSACSLFFERDSVRADS